VRVLIIDGYNDEPAGLGVPPYIDIYPRYIAGAIWTYDPYAEIIYMTIDDVRKNLNKIEKISCDISILIAGVVVPGKYLGGNPVNLKDALNLPKFLKSKYIFLCGPAAKFGFSKGGGSIAFLPKKIYDLYDLVIKGDPEVVIYDFLKNKNINENLMRENMDSINEFSIRGAKIIQQHPYYPNGLICEIETFRGCPRSITGGCSFCIEPIYGLPKFRSIKGVVDEISSLYSYGARNFRIGRQPDILVYQSDENYRPSPENIKKLFSSIRRNAPNIEVLHIDNVNPSTIYQYPKESEEVLKIIVEYHTPGDVAALGIESIDEEVIKKNNLKVDREGAMFSIELINKIGKERGENGLPHLLPGVNFVYGLPGESKKTFEENFEFMKEVLERGLLVRRINLRQLMILPFTRVSSFGDYIIKKHKRLFIEHKKKMRNEIDLPMIRKILPTYTIMKKVRSEVIEGNITWARQIGSYPILVGIPRKLPIGLFFDVVVLDHGPRSVSALPIPIKINSITIKELKSIPGIGEKRAASIIRKRPFSNKDQLLSCIDDPQIIKPIIDLIDFS